MPAPSSAPLTLTWGRVRGHRLRQHGLLEPRPPDSAVKVASTVCGRASAGPRRLLVEEVARLAALLDRDLVLSVGPADIAAHL